MCTLKWEFGVQARAQDLLKGLREIRQVEHKKTQTSDNEYFKDHENILGLETHKTKHKVEFFFLKF